MSQRHQRPIFQRDVASILLLYFATFMWDIISLAESTHIKMYVLKALHPPQCLHLYLSHCFRDFISCVIPTSILFLFEKLASDNHKPDYLVAWTLDSHLYCLSQPSTFAIFDIVASIYCLPHIAGNSLEGRAQ